jgi:hypothetical protein
MPHWLTSSHTMQQFQIETQVTTTMLLLLAVWLFALLLYMYCSCICACWFQLHPTSLLSLARWLCIAV